MTRATQSTLSMLSPEEQKRQRFGIEDKITLTFGTPRCEKRDRVLALEGISYDSVLSFDVDLLVRGAEIVETSFGVYKRISETAKRVNIKEDLYGRPSDTLLKDYPTAATVLEYELVR